LIVHSNASTDAPRLVRIVFSAVDTTIASSVIISADTEVSASTYLCVEFHPMMSPPRSACLLEIETRRTGETHRREPNNNSVG
jgi:hypothetical protein